MKAQVSVGSEPSDAFLVNYGVKQGCVLPPSLFSLYLTAVLETMNEGLNRDVFIRTGTDGKLFNLAQLRAPPKTLEMVSENCSMLMTQPLWPTTQLICSRLWVVSPKQLICLVLRSTYPRPSCTTSLLQCPLNCQRQLRSMMNHWRRLSISLTWAAPSQTPTLRIWKWKGGSNLPGRPMVRYKRDSGSIMTSVQKPKWRFTQLQSSLACFIPSSAPLFTAGTSWLWQDSSFATYAPSLRSIGKTVSQTLKYCAMLTQSVLKP